MMSIKSKTPKIHSIEWGQIIVDNNNKYKDAKIFPGGSKKWDWNRTGTHHIPGIQPADVKKLLDEQAEVIILSKGFNERLQVCSETIQLLKEKEIDYYILQTQEAVNKHNQLCGKTSVGTLIHSTC